MSVAACATIGVGLADGRVGVGAGCGPSHAATTNIDTSKAASRTVLLRKIDNPFPWMNYRQRSSTTTQSPDTAFLAQVERTS